MRRSSVDVPDVCLRVEDEVLRSVAEEVERVWGTEDMVARHLVARGDFDVLGYSWCLWGTELMPWWGMARDLEESRALVLAETGIYH